MKKVPIVILHGWGLSGEKFSPLADVLKKRGYAVFTPDFPGFGSSDMPDHPLTLSDYARFLHEYLQKNSIECPILIGHSFGGRVSLKYQQMYPKSIRVIILTGTPGFTPIHRKKLLAFILLAKIGGAFWSLPPFCLFKETVQRWYYYVVGAREFYRAEGSMRQTFKNIVREELTSAMKSVNIPCALIWGGNDTIVPIRIAQKMSEVIPGATLISIADADHGVPFRQPGIFSDKVEEFIKSL